MSADSSSLGFEGNRQYFSSGKYIYFRGDSGDEFYIIDKGCVELSIFNLEGEKIIICELGPGDHFGQIEIFLKCKRTVNAYAYPKTSIRGFTANEVREKIISDSQSACAIITNLCNLLDKEYQNLEDLFVLNSFQRVSKKLYELSIQNSSEILDIDQEKISNLLAITRETTNRSLNKLKKAGAIIVKRSRIEILDNNFLQRQFIKMESV